MVNHAKSLHISTAIDEKTVATASIHRFLEEAVSSVKTMYTTIEHHILTDTPLKLIPATCPDNMNPKLLQHKRIRLELEASLATATRNASRNSGRQNNDQARNQQPPNQQGVPTLNGQPTDGSANHGGGRGNGGQDGNQGRGRRDQMCRGRGGRVPGVQIRRPNNELGSFYSGNLNAVSLMLRNCQYPICTNFIYVGKECTKSYGFCDKVHTSFDLLPTT